MNPDGLNTEGFLQKEKSFVNPGGLKAKLVFKPLGLEADKLFEYTLAREKSAFCP